MNFNLSAEQMMVRDLCRNLAKNEIIPIALLRRKLKDLRRWIIERGGALRSL
jgi:hypothetical protein